MMHPSHNMMLYDRDTKFVVIDNELKWSKAAYNSTDDALNRYIDRPKSVQISPNQFMFVGSMDITKKCILVDTKK